MKNLFESYNRYTEETEPPTNYHVWTLISCLSACLGRRCFVPQGTFTIYPNLYIVLVGAPGMKKSSAMNIGKSLLRCIPDFPLSPASLTREALLQSLENNVIKFNFAGVPAEYHQISCFVTEFQEFLGGKHRNSSMIDILTAIWDEPTYEYLTKNSKPIRIDAPYVSLLACCTTEWLNEKIDSSIISDGLARRIIFIYEEERNKFVPFPRLTEQQIAEYDFIKKEFIRLQKISGRFDFTEDAITLWEKLYVEIQEEALKQPEFLQYYYTTKHVLMIKVAMCLSAVLRSDMKIDAALIQLVHKMFEAFEENLPSLFRNVGRNKLKPYTEKIFDIVAKNPQGISRGDIINKMSSDISLDELTESLDVLMIGKRIELVDAARSIFRPLEKIKKARKVNLFELIKQYEPSTPIGNLVNRQIIDDLSNVLTSNQISIKQENDRRRADFDEKGFITLT